MSVLLIHTRICFNFLIFFVYFNGLFDIINVCYKGRGEEVLGDRVRKYRKAMGLNLRDFSELSGVGRTTISEIENNRSNPSMETIEKIAKALNVPISNLLDEEDDFMNKSAEEIREEYKALIPKIEKLSKEDKDFIKQMIDRLGGK